MSPARYETHPVSRDHQQVDPRVALPDRPRSAASQELDRLWVAAQIPVNQLSLAGREATQLRPLMHQLDGRLQRQEERVSAVSWPDSPW